MRYSSSPLRCSIDLSLLLLLCVQALGFRDQFAQILDSLDTYENWHRLYGNWIDPDGNDRTAKPGESNISDYNKLPADLIVVRQTFPQLAARCTAGPNLRQAGLVQKQASLPLGLSVSLQCARKEK